MLDWRLTGGALPALGASLSAVFLRRRALWRCRRARQLRLSPSKDVRSWKRPHCWQKRWRLPSRMMLLTCQHMPAGQISLLLAMAKSKDDPQLPWEMSTVSSYCMGPKAQCCECWRIKPSMHATNPVMQMPMALPSC